MSVEAILEKIKQLSEPEQQKIADWFDEKREEAWDREMERDFSPGGRGEYFLAEVEADIAAGRTKPLSEVLEDAQAKAHLEPSHS